MFQARFFDGRSSRAHLVQVSAEQGVLRFRVETEDHAWPLTNLDVETEAQEARIRNPEDPDARLVVAETDWRQRCSIARSRAAVSGSVCARSCCSPGSVRRLNN